MTRDEALRLMEEKFGWKIREYNEGIFAALMEAGLIKFDEPKSPMERLEEEMGKRGWIVNRHPLWIELEEAMRKAKVQLVDK